MLICQDVCGSNPQDVLAALRLLDRVGLDGLTLRKLAAELCVKAPALYRRFKNKQELLDEMAPCMLTDAINEMLPGQRGNGRTGPST